MKTTLKIDLRIRLTQLKLKLKLSLAIFNSEKGPFTKKITKDQREGGGAHQKITKVHYPIIGSKKKIGQTKGVQKGIITPRVSYQWVEVTSS